MRKHGLDPGLVGRCVDALHIEHGVQADLRTQRGTQAAAQLRVILSGQGADIYRQLGGVGHRVNVQASGNGADIQRGVTHQHMLGLCKSKRL